MLTPCNIVVFLQFSVPNDPVCQISSPFVCGEELWQSDGAFNLGYPRVGKAASRGSGAKVITEPIFDLAKEFTALSVLVVELGLLGFVLLNEFS